MFEEILNKIQKTNDFFLSIEVIPSNSGNNNSIFNKIEQSNILNMIDAFVITDSPFGKMKSSPFFMALSLQQKYNKPTITTLSLRDRNKIALQSDILGANEFDVRLFLALTGDKHISKDVKVKNVYEGNSILLLDIIKTLNSQKDYFNNNFKEHIKPIYPFAVSNSYAKDYKRLERKIKHKVDKGALAIFTQPVYCFECIEKLLEIRDNIRKQYSDERRNFEIVFGYFPIMKKRTLDFVDNNIKGIDIPEDYKEKFSKLDETNYEEMLKFNKENFNNLKQHHNKFHLMGLNNFNLIYEILN